MVITNPKIAVLILAAGASTRMGVSIKQLLPWKDTTLLGNAINIAKAADLKNVYVVLGANATVIRQQHKRFSVTFVENKDWKRGLGTSLAQGVSFILNDDPTYHGILVLLADQPLIPPNYLRTVQDHFVNEEKGIVATNYGNRVGVPALFSRAYFEELVKLEKDYGAKELLDKNKSDIFIMQSTPNIIDIDTMEDYFNLNNNII